ncbi:hypothetical protein SETIT_2G417600v2 [Setaria italica]|uniref:Bifunctional inhibitor/plant lipid transfer protein/seed storage helical domain-containing protein n=1 Tax=Setaria italica TaxID=4555 RepID=A0A368Q9F1_SETIT|nr:hypothetical protein SETIT_2G417600v2 [Setaria italica]
MAPSAVSLLAVAVALLGVLQPAATSPPPSPPAAPATGPPVSCASTLYNLFSCTPFLSTGTPLAGPPASCCATLRATLASPDSICLCHLIDGWFNQFANVNIDAVRLALLPIVCLAIVPPELPYVCSEGPVPPIIIVPPGPQRSGTPLQVPYHRRHRRRLFLVQRSRTP